MAVNRIITLLFFVAVLVIFATSALSEGQANQGIPFTIIRMSDARGQLVDIAPVLAEREGALRMLAAPGTWTLRDLGYADLIFAGRDEFQAVSVEYLLPEDTYQGPDGWFVLHTKVHVVFSGAPGYPGYGEAEIFIFSNGAPGAPIEFTYSYDAETRADIHWYMHSVAAGEDQEIHGQANSLIADVSMSCYLPGVQHEANGVQPGRNTLTFVLEQTGVPAVSGLQVLSDSAIEYTTTPPPSYQSQLSQLEKLTQLPEAEAATARQMVLADPRVQELIAGRSYVIDLVMEWDLPQTPEREVRVDICFDKPFKIEYDWPWPPAPIRQGTQHWIRWVQEMTVVTDGQSAVIGIMPERHPLGVGGAPAQGPASDIPRLTDAERTRVTDIVLSDPTVQRLIQGVGYEIGPEGRFGPWYTEKDQRKIGAVLEIRFDSPRWVEADWINIIEYDEAKYAFPHYRQQTQHQALLADGLRISVDLEAGKIAALTPKQAYQGV